MARPIKIEGEPSILESILQYIVDHPKCNRDKVAAHFKLAPRTINAHLLKLRRTGRIKRYVRHGIEGGSLWEIGAESGITPDGPLDKMGEPRQVTVKTWEPETRRDPLISWLHPLKDRSAA